MVGAIRRHEFAVMGAAINLAARLMASKVNEGILVDEAVRDQSDSRFVFKELSPVQAKGYDEPVPIFQPLHAVAPTKKKKSSVPFIGRVEEKSAIIKIAENMLGGKGNDQGALIFLMGESGMGKSALVHEIMAQIKADSIDSARTIVTTKSTSTETDQRVPLR